MTNTEAAAAVAAQCKPGTVLSSLYPHSLGEIKTVERVQGKSVWFTNGLYVNMRSLFHYQVVSA